MIIICRQFGRPELRHLFDEYLGTDMRTVLYFAPPDDPRINVTANLQVPPGLLLAGHPTPGQGRSALGSMNLRFEPDPSHPYTFVDVKMGAFGSSGSVAALRACVVDASTGFSGFAQLPVAGASTKTGSALLQGENLRLGARYTSPSLSAGAIVSPAGAVLHEAWVVRSSGFE